jgi:hypothetical protein
MGLQQFRPPSMRMKSQQASKQGFRSLQATISQQTSPNSVLPVCNSMRMKIKL